ncbi:MAG TPA: outer membrane protein transport protein [Kofleriaceae bacterium]|nr:outer membrane protein transport protein [Kofleriaceae bacterium]
MALFFASAFTVGAGTAHAGGFATAKFGSVHGNAASGHPTAIYFNPAGLALSHGTRIYVEGLFAYREAAYYRPPGAIDTVTEPGQDATGTPEEAVAANSGTAKLSNFLVSPFIGATTDFGLKNAGFGLALYAPFGGSATWDQNEAFENDQAYPGAVDGVQRWSVIEGQQRAIYISAAGAYWFEGPRLSVGGALSVVENDISTVRARNANGTDDLTTADGDVAEGRSLFEGSNFVLAAALGVTWTPVDKVRIGASYQSIPGFGEMELSGTLTNKFGAGMAGAEDTKLTQTLPDIWRLGVTYALNDKVELRAGGAFTRWSVFDDQCLMSDTDTANCDLMESGALEPQGKQVIVNIPRHFKDNFTVGASGSYWLSPTVELFAGASFDSNAVPDETLEQAIIDMAKVTGTVGATLGIGDNLSVLASYTHVAYFERTVEPRTSDPERPSRNPDGAGTYDQFVGFLNVGLGYQF